MLVLKDNVIGIMCCHATS